MQKRDFLNKIEKMGFKYLRVSLTRDCNAACSFCHNEGQEIGKRGNKSSLTQTHLTLDEYKYIAHFFRGGEFKVCFFNRWRTLINPKFTRNCIYF